MFSLIAQPEHKLPELQAQLFEQLATEYTNYKAVELLNRVPLEGRIAITMGFMLAPYVIRTVQRWRKGE